MIDLQDNAVLQAIANCVNSHKSWNKLFGIGLNKTGTTSLNKVAWFLGLSANQEEVEARSALHALRGNYSPFLEVMKKYDFHQDLPISQNSIFVAADTLFPDSKFILTIRSPEEWYRSFMRYYFSAQFDSSGELVLSNDFSEQIRSQNRMTGISREWIFPGYCDSWLEHSILRDVSPNGVSFVNPLILLDKVRMINIYENRNKSIIEYFHGRSGSLLIIDITKSSDISPISSFLGLPAWINFPMPHAGTVTNPAKFNT